VLYVCFLQVGTTKLPNQAKPLKPKSPAPPKSAIAPNFKAFKKTSENKEASQATVEDYEHIMAGLRELLTGMKIPFLKRPTIVRAIFKFSVMLLGWSRLLNHPRPRNFACDMFVCKGLVETSMQGDRTFNFDRQSLHSFSLALGPCVASRLKGS
jgi:hypothetical protein